MFINCECIRNYSELSMNILQTTNIHELIIIHIHDCDLTSYESSGDYEYIFLEI
jgi:hypothetical protein